MLSIIIPFYNEAESLPVLVEQLINTMGKIKEDYEIVLVDDGSTDDWHKNFQDPITRK